MTCTNFPSAGLVDGVTTHLVGDVTFLWKGGVWETITVPLKHSQLSELNAPGTHDAIYRRATTVAEIATGVFSVGDKLTITDRANASFDVVSGGSANGFDILDAGAGKTAILYSNSGEVNALWFGVNPDNTDVQNTPAVAAAHATGKVVYYPGAQGKTYKFTKLTTPILYGGIRGDGLTLSILEFTDATASDVMFFDGRWEAFFPTQSQSAFVFRDFAMIGPSTGGVPDKLGGSCIVVTAPAAEPTQRENQGTTFDNVMFRQVYSGIHFKAASYWRVKGCLFNTYVGQGVLVENLYDADSGDGSIGGGCVFVTNPTDQGAAGIRQKSGGGLRISDTKVLGGTFGYQLEYNTTATVGQKATANLLITGSSFELMQFGAISLTSNGVHPFKHVIINDNEIALTTYGIATDATGFISKMTIIGNSIEVWGGYTAASYFCIGLNGAQNVSISGNTLTGIGGTSKCISLLNCTGKVGVNTYVDAPDPIAISGGTISLSKDTQSGSADSSVTGWVGYGSLFRGPVDSVTFPVPFLVAPAITDITLTAGDGTRSVGGIVNSVSKTGFTYLAIGTTADALTTTNWAAKGVM